MKHKMEPPIIQILEFIQFKTNFMVLSIKFIIQISLEKCDLELEERANLQIKFGNFILYHSGIIESLFILN